MRNLLVLISVFLTSIIAQATEASLPYPVPEGDPIALLVDLVRNWSVSSPFVVGMSLIVILVQIIKKSLPGFKYNRLAVVALSCIYGAIAQVHMGLGWVSALSLILVSGGGAVALYEAWKGISKAAVKAT